MTTTSVIEAGAAYRLGRSRLRKPIVRWSARRAVDGAHRVIHGCAHETLRDVNFCIWRPVLPRCRPSRASQALQTYPTRPVRIIVPFGRAVRPTCLHGSPRKNYRATRQAVHSVENIVGGAGNVGTGQGGHGPAPDGYTFLFQQ